MTKCTQASLRFPGCQGRRVEADFSGGEITGDAGVLLLRQADGVLKLSEAVARALRDSRRRASCEHASLSLVRQRLYALALGYEDLNDHQGLRGDVALQTAVGRTRALASASTLSRWENRSDRAQAWRLHEVSSSGRSATRHASWCWISMPPTTGFTVGRRVVLSRVLRPLLFFAAVCILRRSGIGELSAPEQDRRGQTCVGDPGVVGEAAASGVAAGADRVSGRQRFLPPTDVALV